MSVVEFPLVDSGRIISEVHIGSPIQRDAKTGAHEITFNLATTFTAVWDTGAP